jgi:hypothetical protein
VLASFPRTLRGLRIVQVVVVVLAVATAGVGTFLTTQGSQVTVISADDVLAAFRDEATPSPEAAAAPSAVSDDDPEDLASHAPIDDASVVPDASVTSGSAEPREHAADHNTGEAAPTEEPSTTEPPPVEPGAAPTFGMPDEGVYTYVTEGWETVSMAGARHDYPSETFAAVRHLGGCGWETDHQFVEEHRERKEYCSDGSALLALGFDSYITFFGQTAESHGRCDPPQVSAHLPAEPGQRYTSSCAGDGWTSEAIVTFVGRESLEVGGQALEALHYTQETTLQGSNRGQSHMDVWYDPSTGLPLEVIRTTQSFTHAFGSEVEYNEDVRFVLASLAPQR